MHSSLCHQGTNCHRLIAVLLIVLGQQSSSIAIKNKCHINILLVLVSFQDFLTEMCNSVHAPQRNQHVQHQFPSVDGTEVAVWHVFYTQLCVVIEIAALLGV